MRKSSLAMHIIWRWNLQLKMKYQRVISFIIALNASKRMFIENVLLLTFDQSGFPCAKNNILKDLHLIGRVFFFSQNRVFIIGNHLQFVHISMHLNAKFMVKLWPNIFLLSCYYHNSHVFNAFVWNISFINDECMKKYCVDWWDRFWKEQSNCKINVAVNSCKKSIFLANLNNVFSCLKIIFHLMQKKWMTFLFLGFQFTYHSKRYSV